MTKLQEREIKDDGDEDADDDIDDDDDTKLTPWGRVHYGRVIFIKQTNSPALENKIKSSIDTLTSVAIISHPEPD
jgi:hypothetical protein